MRLGTASDTYDLPAFPALAAGVNPMTGSGGACQAGKCCQTDPGGPVKLCQPSVKKCLLDPALDPGLVFKGVSKYCINIWKTQVQYGVLSRNLSRKYMFCPKNRCAVKTRSTIGGPLEKDSIHCSTR